MTLAQRIAAGLVGAILLAAAGADASGSRGVDEARSLFREAALAAEAGDWVAARDKYVRSLALRRSALTLYNLGIAQKHCGALVAARQTLSEYLVEPQTERSEAFRADAEAEIRELSARISQVAFVFDRDPPPGVQASIDGVTVLVSRIDAAHPIDPGRHVVRVEAPGAPPFETTIDVAEGETTTVPVRTQAPTPRPPPPPPPEPTGAPPPLAPIVLMASGGAVALAGLSVGVAGFVKAGDAAIDEDGASSARAMGIAADVLMPAGVAAAGIGLVLFFVLPDEPAQPGDARARVRPGAGGLVVSF